ncbi:TraB/GumN family protein [Parasphingorhabdus halotolerans]|uniref:TraB/GumN family protein n=1 Tax=Parasphingorhabdus halotolerans TaxID=2725558 RepID=A0A6H2DJ34_9SPHN|nr:TraB/GumN family protein [Parasphingorhabdus halotolerans]QJB68400.1 TraB/GumN family protein [Parasphingorhabdus halotolerans]
MHHLRAFLSIILAACLAACSNTPGPPALDTVKQGHPGLWKVTGTKPEQQGTAYMFGTIHLLPKDVQWHSPALEAAITESDRLIIEVLGLEDTKAAAKIFSKLAISTDQPSVDTRIAPSLRDELDGLMRKIAIPAMALNRMETWAVALSLASAQTNNLGLSSGEGVEKKLSAQFRQSKKPIQGLETIAQQLGYFDQLPEAQQRQMLASVVKESGETKESFEELFNAWISGDTDKIVELSDGGILDDPQLRETLLTARNRDWANQLEKQLQGAGTSFVAVGAAHLAGSDAVQTMLEKRGFKVEKIQ